MAKFALKANRIESCLRTLKKRLSSLTLRLNAEAASRMKAGQYNCVKELMDVGTSISKFSLAVEELTENWRTLSENAGEKIEALGIGSDGAGQTRRVTSRQLCLSALKAVIGRGGAAKADEIASFVESDGSLNFSDADLALSRRNGRPRWHTTLDRAYKQCERKGWIEAGSNGTWAITQLGRKLIAS
jgi:hypothetical protein